MVKDTTYKDLQLSIRVSSAAGTTIQWDGKDALSPEEAQKVASKNVTRDFLRGWFQKRWPRDVYIMICFYIVLACFRFFACF